MHLPVIREITPVDAGAATNLSAELGYPVHPDDMRQRIQSFLKMPDHAVYVACVSGSVVGWIDAGIVHHLQAESRAEIGGLVVSSAARSQGIGRLLVERVEQWARQNGLGSIVVRSQIIRDDAHRFYLREGYQRTKTSAVFTKHLV